MILSLLIIPESRVTLTSWGEGVSLAWVGQPFGDGITIIITYGVDVLLHQPPRTHQFLLGLRILNINLQIN